MLCNRQSFIFYTKYEIFLNKIFTSADLRKFLHSEIICKQAYVMLQLNMVFLKNIH